MHHSWHMCYDLVSSTESNPKHITRCLFRLDMATIPRELWLERFSHFSSWCSASFSLQTAYLKLSCWLETDQSMKICHNIKQLKLRKYSKICQYGCNILHFLVLNSVVLVHFQICWRVCSRWPSIYCCLRKCKFWNCPGITFNRFTYEVMY